MATQCVVYFQAHTLEHTHTGKELYVFAFAPTTLPARVPISASVIPFTMLEFFQHFVWKISKFFAHRKWVNVKNECRATEKSGQIRQFFISPMRCGRCSCCTKIPKPNRQTHTQVILYI